MLIVISLILSNCKKVLINIVKNIIEKEIIFKKLLYWVGCFVLASQA